MLNLLAWVLLGAAALLFWRAQGLRERVLQAARLRCQREQLQLLDEAVSLRGLWLRRDEQGQLRWWRRWLFEFSATGDERNGMIFKLLIGLVVAIRLPPHRFSPSDDHTLH